MKKIVTMVVFCCLMAFIFVNTSGCKKKAVQTSGIPPVAETEAPIVSQKGTEPESIKTLQAIALKNFDEQMQAIIAESLDKDKKIEIFETSMTALAQEYYRYYVEEAKEGIEIAKTNFTAFLTTFKSPDGIGLTKDSIPYYLERMKAK